MWRLHRHTVPVPGVYMRTGRRNSSCSTGCSFGFQLLFHLFCVHDNEEAERAETLSLFYCT